MAEILFMPELDQGQIHQPMFYGSRGPDFLVLSTSTANKMQHRYEASEGPKTTGRVQKLSIKEKKKGKEENALME